MSTHIAHRTGPAHEIARQVTRCAARATRTTVSPLQATAAAPLWRALSDESAIWMLMPVAPGRNR
jgi:hypothetical protein